MDCRRTHAAALLLLAMILIIFAPLSFAAPSANAVIEATSEGLARLDVRLMSRKEVLRFEFNGTDGLVVGGIPLPSDGLTNYEITAFDAEGRATHSGKGSIRALAATDRPVLLPLPPTGQELGGGSGLVVSVTRERLVLEAKQSGGPNDFVVTVEPRDAAGNPANFDPKDIRWDLSDVRHFELIPRPDRYEVELHPRKEFPVPFKWCDVPTVVQACLPNTNCKAIRVCPDPWVTISAGGDHTCALTKSGVAQCWGSNDQGQLGAPTTTACTNGGKCSTRPLRVVCPVGAPCRFTQISAGQTLTVAIDTNGDTWQWGRGAPGHLKVSATLAGNAVGFLTVAAGFGHACGISSGRSEVWCWGANGYGEAGAPLPIIDVPYTAAVRVLPPIAFKKIVAGGEHTCAVGSAGTDVVCWGRNDQKQTSGTSFSQYPAGTGQFFFQLFGGLVSINDAAASMTSSCVTLGNGNGVRCWGDHAPLNVLAFGVPDRLTAGFGQVCAILNQLATCVGTNNWGELGIGSLIAQATPVAVKAPPPLYTTISAGDSHTCGLTPGGDAFCWGKNLSGQVGNGTSNYGLRDPTLVPTP